MSPLSETTNLAAAVAGTDLYKHIRSMMSTTIPAILITLGIYLVLGLQAKPTGGILGVTTLAYLPFAFFNWINPVISFIYAALGIAIQKVQPGTDAAPAPAESSFYGVSGQNAEEVPEDGSRR